jgi:hypothetical protein
VWPKSVKSSCQGFFVLRTIRMIQSENKIAHPPKNARPTAELPALQQIASDLPTDAGETPSLATQRE